jgi:predicted NACHT family NTPase
LKEEKEIVLIEGDPGAGKTIFMHNLLVKYGGLNKNTQKEMIEILVRNNAVPILINLKNCFNESLESIIRGRKNDSKVCGENLGFIYILDGLDELDSERADFIISQIEELNKKDNTKKIIISSRSGNLNILVLKSTFNEGIDEYKINDLD